MTNKGKDDIDIAIDVREFEDHLLKVIQDYVGKNQNQTFTLATIADYWRRNSPSDTPPLQGPLHAAIKALEVRGKVKRNGFYWGNPIYELVKDAPLEPGLGQSLERNQTESLTPAKAYAIAHEIDAELNWAMQKHDVRDPANYYGWQVLIRTVKSSLDIISNCVKEPTKEESDNL